MKINLLILALTLTVLLCLGCVTKEPHPSPQQATFDQLFSNPKQFNGRDIIIEGFYFQGFEVVVLSENLDYSGYAQGHLIPKGRILWVEGGIPKEIYDKLNQQQMMGPSEYYGKIRIRGKFEFAEKFGYLGQYEYQIIPLGVELLPWSPPAKESETHKGEGFAIYLLTQEMTVSEISSINQMKLKNVPIISIEDIVSYNRPTHEIILATEAMKRLLELDVPLNGKVFVVCVDRQPIYWGAFWTPISSISFDGVTILKPLSSNLNTIKIELGYPSGSSFSGDDPRAESRIIKSLEQASKLLN